MILPPDNASPPPKPPGRLRVLHIGDIVGKPGRKIVVRAMRPLIRKLELDLVIANAENAAGGSGLTPDIYFELTRAGVGAITLGDHIYRRREIFGVLQREKNIVKPANYPPDAPGHGVAVVESHPGAPVAVISLLGRVFMKPVDCPFQAVDRILAELDPAIKTIFVDMHAEATSDKQLMGRYLDGRVTSVLGTHTHVPTADSCILPGGTAFQCDLGMTGPYDSILGRQVDRVMETTITFQPTSFAVATGDVRMSGAIVDLDRETGRAKSIHRLLVTEDEAEQLAAEYRQRKKD